MRVLLLGPIDVTVGGVSQPLRGWRRKGVLAVLALHHGEIVSTDRLIDIIWGDSQPATAPNTLQTHVSQLRHVLGGKAAIVARKPGYLLDLGDGAIDVQVAQRLVHSGLRLGPAAERAGQLRAALELWRGRPLADVAGLPWLDEQAERLDRLWLQATLALTQARLDLGEHAELVPDLEQLARDHPFDEGLHGQLMLALYRSGRQAAALASFQHLRQALADDLGIDPSQPLRDLEGAILRQDPALATPVPAIALRGPAPPVPAQLPAGIPGFAGRIDVLARLDEIAHAGPAVVCVVSGTAGVGKTALAVHWGHRATARFPDGQLYVNLRGFDPTGPAMDPADTLRGFLEAFDVPAQRIPSGVQARAGLYRSLLAGRRLLVVLDNARDEEQVRPLLPGTPGCVAVVTSRSGLAGLVVRDGAHPVTLDLLTPAEARDLLAGRIGADRVAGAPDAVADILAACACLPLTLAIAAARAAGRPDFPLAAVATDLRAARALDAFRGGDIATDVRAVFSWSYRALRPEAARLFRLTALHPGPDLSLAALASLAGVPTDRARGPLAELTGAHLLLEATPGRYGCHDLLRAYADELSGAEDGEDERGPAVRRMLDHYLHSGCAAARLLEPYPPPMAPIPASPGVTVTAPATADDARAWFGTEHAALLGTLRVAAGCGLDTHAWQLAWTVTTFFVRIGHWDDQDLAQGLALAAARRLGDPVGLGHARHAAAIGHGRSGRLDQAHTGFGQALAHFAAAGDTVNQGYTLLRLGWIATRQDHHAEALDHVERAYELFRSAGYDALHGRVLNNIGWCHAQLGHYEEALEHCERALAATEEAGERSWEAGVWDSLGFIHFGLSNLDRSVACYRRAVELYRQLGDRYYEAETLACLGDVHDAADDRDAARHTWRLAHGILVDLQHPDATDVWAKLARSAAVSAPPPPR